MQRVNIDEIIGKVDNKIVIMGNDKVLNLDDFLTPHLTLCHNCPIRMTCPAREASEERDPPGCLIEEGLMIEATKDLIRDYGISLKDKLTMFSFNINLLNLHRMSRVGARINFAMNDKDNFDIMNKYMAMLAKVDGRYHKALQELQATKREVYKIKQNTEDSNTLFIQKMSLLADQSKKKLRDTNESTVKISDD